jgi:hypothetical protein
MEDVFMARYAQLVAYHTLLTQFTQIHLEKNERIKDFNLCFFKILQQIPKEKCPNEPVIFGCYKNAMPSNVKYVVKYYTNYNIG